MDGPRDGQGDSGAEKVIQALGRINYGKAGEQINFFMRDKNGMKQINKQRYNQ